MFRNALSRYTSSALRAPSPQRGRLSQRGSPSKQVLPRTQKLSPLCTPPLSLVAPGLPVLRGVSGGGAALSPGFSLHLCSPEQIGAHFAAQSPERAFLAKPFFARAKNGVNLRRRSLKISVGKTKPDSEPSPLRGRWRRSRRMRCSATARYRA